MQGRAVIFDKRFAPPDKASADWASLKTSAGESARVRRGRLAIQFAIPVVIVAPAFVELIRREGSAVVLQFPGRGLARGLA